MDPGIKVVVFLLDRWRFALRLAVVDEAVGVAEIRPMPRAPSIVLGVINVRGEVVPVLDVRERFNLSKREMELSDRLLLGRAHEKRVALLVDDVEGIVDIAGSELKPADALFPGLDYIDGVAKRSDGLIFIHDLDTFLSAGEAAALQTALGDGPGRTAS